MLIDLSSTTKILIEVFSIWRKFCIYCLFEGRWLWMHKSIYINLWKFCIYFVMELMSVVHVAWSQTWVHVMNRGIYQFCTKVQKLGIGIRSSYRYWQFWHFQWFQIGWILGPSLDWTFRMEYWGIIRSSWVYCWFMWLWFLNWTGPLILL